MSIKYSKVDHDSKCEPFFNKIIDSSNIDISLNNIVDIENLDKFKNIKMQNEITEFFIKHGKINRELYIENFTFFSIKKILDIIEYYKKNDILNIIDLGYTYIGMGWVNVAFYNLNSKKIYIRKDGGSNYWDREDNFNRLKKYSKIENISNIAEISLGIDFNELLDKIYSNQKLSIINY